jgi:hypothetical protein
MPQTEPPELLPATLAPVSRLSRVGVFAALAWVGMYIHNRADLPALTLLSVENLGPALVWVLLVVFYWRFAHRRWAVGLLAAWGLLNLVGGFLSVLPLPFLPYAPEQSLRHYGFHVLYAATQVPLLALARSQWRQTRPMP